MKLNLSSDNDFKSSVLEKKFSVKTSSNQISCIIPKEKKFKVLLTSRLPIKELNIRLEDLKSRLLAYSHSKILLPTDDVLRGIIIKISKDKGLLLSDNIINYILSHVERSYSIINRFINELDQLSLIRKKKITIPFIKKLIENKL